MIVQILSIFICILIHILGFFDIIQQAAKKIKQELLTSLNKLNQTQQTSITSFDENMKILTEMISDVSSVVTKFNNLYSISFLFIEISSLASLFICGLIFIVVRQQYIFAISIILYTVVLYSFCYVNEKILDGFNNIKAELYDIPWYGLPVKQRQVLLITMNCDKIQKGFSVAGIHDLTIERFRIVVKAGYTNLVILKDLVQK